MEIILCIFVWFVFICNKIFSLKCLYSHLWSYHSVYPARWVYGRQWSEPVHSKLLSPYQRSSTSHSIFFMLKFIQNPTLSLLAQVASNPFHGIAWWWVPLVQFLSPRAWSTMGCSPCCKLLNFPAYTALINMPNQPMPLTPPNYLQMKSDSPSHLMPPYKRVLDSALLHIIHTGNYPHLILQASTGAQSTSIWRFPYFVCPLFWDISAQDIGYISCPFICALFCWSPKKWQGCHYECWSWACCLSRCYINEVGL